MRDLVFSDVVVCAQMGLAQHQQRVIGLSENRVGRP